MKSEWMWNRLAKNWDKPGVSLGQNDIAILEKTRKYLKPTDVVMDCGCATGSIALEIAGGVREVRGIDISSRMIELARNKALDREVSNAAFIHSTIFDSNLKKDSFNVILSFSTLHLVENITDAFNRINSLLKPGGFFISATPCIGQKDLLSILITIPLFISSGIGLLPHINFFGIRGLSNSITGGNFRIVETEKLSASPVNEVFIVARKLE
jgi:ubiquinone/menaquinone biosynthesis C-methylase UbiE